MMLDINANIEWNRHSLQGVQQNQAKRDGMECLNDFE